MERLISLSGLFQSLRVEGQLFIDSFDLIFLLQNFKQKN